MLFRIFTEDKNRDALRFGIAERFDAFTLLDAWGFWKGEPEKSLVIEIVGDPEIEATVRELALWIKRTNEQEAVLIERLENHSELV